MISMDKKYKTRSGLPAKIYATNGENDFPIHGAVYYLDEWHMEKWTSAGHWYLTGIEDELDLIEDTTNTPNAQ